MQIRTSTHPEGQTIHFPDVKLATGVSAGYVCDNARHASWSEIEPAKWHLNTTIGRVYLCDACKLTLSRDYYLMMQDERQSWDDVFRKLLDIEEGLHANVYPR